METNDAAEQLEQVRRLRAATLREAGRTPRTALIVMPIAVVVYFSGYSSGSRAYEFVAPVAWLAFVAGWVTWLRRGNRVRPGRPERSRDEKVRDLLLWGALFVVANAIVALASR